MTILKIILRKILKTIRFFTRKDININDVYALKSGLVKTGVSYGTDDYKALHYLLHEYTRLKHMPEINIIERSLSVDIDLRWVKDGKSYFLILHIVKFKANDVDNRYLTVSNFEIKQDKLNVVGSDNDRTYSYWGDCNFILEIADNLDMSVNDFMKARR